jgi:N-acetylneuraminic acid mutarotase
LTFVTAAHAEPRWTMAAPLPVAIGELEATEADGKLYVLSGLDNRPDVVAPTGYNWMYDEAANKWVERAKMPVPAHHIMVTTLNEKIYVFGGFVRHPSVIGWQPTAKSFEYDPATDKWRELAPMPTPRGAGQAVAVGGKIYVIGGGRSNKPGEPGAPIPRGSVDQIVVGTNEEYDPATNTWRARADMPQPRNHYLAEAVDGKIYAIDGRIGSVFVTKSDTIDLVESYDPVADHWSYASRAPSNRGDVAGDEHNGIIYIAGGEFQDFERKMTFWSVETFNPKTGAWGSLPHMLVARHGFGAAIVGNKLHVVGGGFQSDGMPGVDPTTGLHEVFDLDAK